MPTEIERKYLVDPIHPDVVSITKSPGHLIEQGYMLSEARGVLRVRVMDGMGFLTYKGKTTGLSRPEFEYPIPVEDARDLLAHHCFATLRKTRHKVALDDGLIAELDIFDDRNLALVEVELDHADQTFAVPDWFGQEVSTDPTYANNNLARPVVGKTDL